MGWTARRWFPSNFLLLFRFVVCLKLGESLQEVKGDKSGADGDKKDKKMRGKKRKKSAVSRKRSPDKAPRQLQRLVKYKSWRRWWWQTLWRTVSAWKMYLNKFPNIIVQISKCIWRTALVHRGTWLAYRHNYVNARSFSFWNSVIQCSGYSDILIPLTRIVDKYNG